MAAVERGESSQWSAASHRLERVWPFVVSAVLGAWTLSALLARTGEAAAPLDDTYIHFQYARAFAEFRPFAYTEGAAAAPGTTSLLWPLVLAPFSALFRGSGLLWPAWAIGFLSLGLLAQETRRLARGLVSGPLPNLAAALVLGFGGLTWFAASGMEVVPFAWLLARSARASSDWCEFAPLARSRRAFWTLVVTAALSAWMRPEGALAVFWTSAALLWAPREGRRAWAALPLMALPVPNIVYALATGQAMATTTAAKWLPFNPYFSGDALFPALAYNARLLLDTLLDGRIWASVFLPEGGRAVWWIALGLLPVAGWRHRHMPRAVIVGVLALGMFIPTSYETFLVNRLRYLWPFFPAWCVALLALWDTIASALVKVHPMLRRADAGLATASVALLGWKLPGSVRDLAESADAVFRQQVALGRWVARELPATSVVGLNDAGAIAYYGEHQTFDVVGLTTRGEARYWAAGPGSRFEHYERLGAGRMPEFFVVYRQWFALDPLLGPELTRRTVYATILGGPTMSAHVANYRPLGSAEMPDHPPDGKLIDRLDVADLESEAAHEYALFDARQAGNRIFQDADRVDGGRADRSVDHFRMRLEPGGTLEARVAVDAKVTVHLSLDGQPAGAVVRDTTRWGAVRFAVPATVEPAVHVVRIWTEGQTPAATLHYWSYGAK